MNIQNLTMTGSDVSYTAPADCIALIIQARTTDVSMKLTASGAVFTLYSGAPGITLSGRDISRQTLLFNAASGTIEIMEQTGLAC